MKKLCLVLLFVVTPAFAQQPESQLVLYRQMLDNANWSLVQTIDQLQKAQTRVKELEEKCEPKK